MLRVGVPLAVPPTLIDDVFVVCGVACPTDADQEPFQGHLPRRRR